MIRAAIPFALAVLVAGGLAGCAPQPQAQHVATFQVAGDQTYKIALDTPELVKHAEELLAGKEVPAIPVGKIVRGSSSVNAPWSWHIDPSTLHFADFTTEVCDGLPSYVEDRTLTSDTYCSWAATVIAVS